MQPLPGPGGSGNNIVGYAESLASFNIYRILNKFDYCIKIEYCSKNKRAYEANVPII